ncbi:exo-alpha-sialidase [Acidobacteriia bacterium AH_259_A11_L15]|nr:exo-alpha-sialidase [Acidobacteriia bacterium AH_259_A11_L15]
MPKKSKLTRSKTPRAKEVQVLVGTRKGGFLLRSDERRKNWKVEGPLFPGWEVNHLVRDPRSGRLWAALNVSWWGNDLQVSDDGGQSWQKTCTGLEFAPERNLKLNRIWQVTPDRDSRPDTLWCGVDPGALFRSDDSGKNWYELRSLTEHPTREKWQPGGGGMMVHTIVPDPNHPQRLYVGISAAGCFRSDDDGNSWQPFNQGVRADFLPDTFPDVGQCVHRMVLDPQRPDVLYQQNHCGVYRSPDSAASWEDISEGLPSRFGFPIVAHPHQPGTLYVVPAQAAQFRFTPDGRFRVFRSKNGGRSWQALTRGLPQENAWLLVLRHAACADPCDSAGIYVGATTGEIFYSTNSGDSWALMPFHLPPILSLEAAVA